MSDDLSQLWSRIEALEKAVSTLIGVVQTTSLTDEVRTQLAEMKASLDDLPARPSTPAEITVGRINVREPDGTLRMTISNQDRAPNGVINGKEFGGREGGNAAGIVFYNNNGDECGGLCYQSQRMPDGSVQAFASLTFDRYQQDQVTCLQMFDENAQVTTALSFWDRPTMPLDQYIERALPIFQMPRGPEQEVKLEELRQAGLLSAQRLYVMKRHSTAMIGLCDAQSRPRIRLFTEADGRAGLEFLDEAGNVTHRWPDTDSA